tara:strand:+ start:84 stop:272 length:189 start_codon:yes stop_codon:yes gene_type:complete
MENTISKDFINEIKYEITNKLVLEGVIKDCTDTDDEDEVTTENVIEEVLTEKLKELGFEIKE